MAQDYASTLLHDIPWTASSGPSAWHVAAGNVFAFEKFSRNFQETL